MQGILLTSDLFFSSRISELARQASLTLHVAPSEQAALDQARAGNVRLIVVDLANLPCDLPGFLAELDGRSELTVVAFGPHVDTQALDAARAAGCDEVMSRGQFNQQAVEIMRRYLSPG